MKLTSMILKSYDDCPDIGPVAEFKGLYGRDLDMRAKTYLNNPTRERYHNFMDVMFNLDGPVKMALWLGMAEYERMCNDG